ncbi:sulfite exporter TauE/SafE family protein [Galbibacter pacificus]|uniref:Probable membrane transporter protein n=1 Tax=Galbibacter pacificus TaxID=2996052 RepID=A0ABT6FNB1_9FLAO|nr:sulfite exporter TauE/SafE family protein [Galbibacter pacificus]MDG3581217.1 sulfite exporter TauE/SafE family protein [Galbibacter pacificus]MDG3584695.1 sulfite exporter TauE/SafE family protein [Galbibacter pacificus]
MDIVEIFGYSGAFLIGLVLGLIGGGGAILTVPLLVYALALNPVTATAYSLFVVGATSLIGALKNMAKGMVDFKTAIPFAIPAFVTIYLTRAYLVPALPKELFKIGGFAVTKDLAIMLFFAMVMLSASLTMIGERSLGPKTYNAPLLITQGLIVGLVTGIIGAGGGFLIIPALVLLAKLPMKKAVATSLFIIGINSLTGFFGDVQNLDIDWPFLLTFTGISIMGITMGIWINNFIEGKKLKKTFGWFVLIMGVYILYKELSLTHIHA